MGVAWIALEVICILFIIALILLIVFLVMKGASSEIKD